MTALTISARTLVALFAAMALMFVVVLATVTATSSDHAAVAIAARLLGHPVKWVETRSEAMLSMHGRGQVQYAELGLKGDGTITGLRLRILGECGAYAGFGGALAVGPTYIMAPGPYVVPRLRFDALVTPVQLPALLSMLDRNPALSVVVDHGAKPDIANGGWQPWADLIREVGARPQVHCKLSGLVTEAGVAWDAESLRPYVAHLLECFGARRILWGSDWPVVNLAGGFARWREATAALLASSTDEDRAAILGGSARRFYALAG